MDDSILMKDVLGLFVRVNKAPVYKTKEKNFLIPSEILRINILDDAVEKALGEFGVELDKYKDFLFGVESLKYRNGVLPIYREDRLNAYFNSVGITKSVINNMKKCNKILSAHKIEKLDNDEGVLAIYY